MSHDKFNGSYTLIDKDADNFEKYMSAVGVGFILKKAAKNMSQSVKIEVDGENIHVITTSPVKSSDEKFVFGVVRPVTTMDGRKVQCSLSKQGNDILMVEDWDSACKHSEITLKILDDGNMVFELRAGGVECNRVYKRN